MYAGLPVASSIVALAALILPRVTAANVPIRPRAGSAPSPWVTVDNDGNVATVTPSVSLGKDTATTISAPPSYLTQTSAYTLTVSGHATTTTGQPPVASATGTGLAGAFVVCNNYQGVDAPFCQPQGGSALAVGKTYYVTWDPAYFASPDTMLEVQGQYSSSDEGFTTSGIPAGQGFFIWDIDSTFLTSQGVGSLNVTLSLAFVEDSGDEPTNMRAVGPTLLVTAPSTASTGSGVSALAIALPVALGVVALGLLGFCIWSYRRRGRLPIIGALGKGRSSGQGYGVRQSHAQRTGTIPTTAAPEEGRKAEPAVGIQLTDRDSWSPTQGRNVFREELRRQDEETK